MKGRRQPVTFRQDWPSGEIGPSLFHMKMPPAFLSCMPVSLREIMYFFRVFCTVSFAFGGSARPFVSNGCMMSSEGIKTGEKQEK